MKLGYNTNGLGSHRLEDAIALVGELGYQALAITIDHHALDPYAESTFDQIREWCDGVVDYVVDCVATPESQQQIFDLVSPGGHVGLIGTSEWSVPSRSISSR